MRSGTNTDRRKFLAGTTALGAIAAIPGARLGAIELPADFIMTGMCRGVNQAAAVAASGAAYIEAGVRNLLVPEESEAAFEAALKTCRDNGLETPACNSFLSGQIKSVGPDRDLNKLLDYAATTFRRAEIAGVKHIIYGSGASRRIPPKYSRARAKLEFVENLAKMAPIAQRHGVSIAVEPLHSKGSNFINTMIEGAEICDMVNHQHVGLVCDYFHVTQEGRGPEDVRRAAKYIKTLHIAEDEGRAPPGTHGDDFRPFFRTLKKAGFEGNCSIECRWTDIDTQGPVAVDTIRKQIADVAKEA